MEISKDPHAEELGRIPTGSNRRAVAGVVSRNTPSAYLARYTPILYSSYRAVNNMDCPIHRRSPLDMHYTRYRLHPVPGR